MIIGFDVMNDILLREKNGNVINQIDKAQNSSAIKFEYVRVKKKMEH